MKIKPRTTQGVNCLTCSAANMCIAGQLNAEEIEQLDNIIEKVYVLQPKEHLYFINHELRNLLAVYSGCCKDYEIDTNANEKINNFYFAGDILGLESIAKGKYQYSAVAVTEAVICVIPLKSFIEKGSRYPNLLRRLATVCSQALYNEKFIPPTTNAKQRVADFLINIYQRMHERNLSCEPIELPMSQIDISNKLGLAFETVSRILHGFHDKQVIRLQNKKVEILNLNELCEIGATNADKL